MAMAMTSRPSVREMVSQIEAAPDPLGQHIIAAKTGRFARYRRLLEKFLRSRFMGLAFGPAYGLFIYLYITHLILAGAPFTKERTTENQTIQVNQIPHPENMNPSKEVPMVNLEEPDFIPLMTTATSHLIGGAAGTGVGLGLTAGLLPSPRFPNFLARTTFVLVSLSEVKIPGQDATFGDFVFNSSKMQERGGKG